MNRSAGVQSDRPAMSVGSRKRDVPIVVHIFPAHHHFMYTMLTLITYSTGRCRPREIKIKEEPKFPKNPTRKQRVYAISNTNSIGIMDVHDVDAEPTQPPAKHRKTAVGSSSRV